MGDIGHAPRADALCDLLERLKVDLAWVGACTADDHLWFDDPCHLLDDRVVESLRLRVDTVVEDGIPAPGDVDWRAVRKMAALGEALAHNLVLIVEVGEVDRLICLTS